MTLRPSSTSSDEDILARRAKLLAERNEFRKEVLLSKEGQEMVKEKVEEVRAEIAIVNADYEHAKKMLANCSADQVWIWEFNLEDAEKRLKEKRSLLNRWLRLKTDGWRPVGERQQFDLEVVRQVPIEDIMTTPPSSYTEDRAMYRCPIHNERTASFVVYRDQNTWWCFGHNEGGDVIDLYQKLNNCSFIEACRLLTS